ncbi:ATP-binding protein [uncultured Streptomyces sp.]|uniref:ATP-binding protein n=1 Tax=uncultured Streptomyces sp. TaxID=174707 RepID=UPI00260820E3|nr:ATP-binding protein [uncultured Streptomyces sp.]
MASSAPGTLVVSASYEGGEGIGEARALAREFLADVQAVHGLPVSDRVMGTVQLVVSELVTNAHKYAPGPYALTLAIREGAVEVTVWDGEPAVPMARAADTGRIGQHGMEIVMAVCRSFEVHREPVGKRVRATVVLADDPAGNMVGRLI